MHLTSSEKYYRKLLLNCVEDFQKAAEEKRFVSAEIFVKFLPKEIQKIIKLSKIKYWDSLGRDIKYVKDFWNHVHKWSTGKLVSYIFARLFYWFDTREGQDYWDNISRDLEYSNFNVKDFPILFTSIKYLV
jgi:hypothetical protein